MAEDMSSPRRVDPLIALATPRGYPVARTSAPSVRATRRGASGLVAIPKALLCEFPLFAPPHTPGYDGSSEAPKMLLFIDESGHDGHKMPCEVLAGVAIAEDNLWNLVQAIRSTEREHFGDYLRNLLTSEIKGAACSRQSVSTVPRRTCRSHRKNLQPGPFLSPQGGRRQSTRTR